MFNFFSKAFASLKKRFQRVQKLTVVTLVAQLV